MKRRAFLESSLTAAIGGLLLPSAGWTSDASNLKIATFRFDVTPPMGHPLCGGWIKAASDVDDPLEAIGLVITGAGKPIVICAVDWTGLLNEAHIQWRQSLAKGAGTSPDRVAVQCVHQHNAPFVCLESNRILSNFPEKFQTVNEEFFAESLGRAETACRAALQSMQPLTHIAVGQAKVEKVAGNRRFVGADGTLTDWRASSSKVPRHWELPEGLIDPWMKTVAFYHGEQKVAACHYYATHPMSYYGDGRISSEFVGLARKRRQAEDSGCTHLYFTGCSGNVAAGKYNNGTPQARVELTDRIYNAMVASDSALKPAPVQQVEWQSRAVNLPPRELLNEDGLLKQIADSAAPRSERTINAMRLAWLRRCQAQVPVILSALHINEVTLLHLPAESFVEYQLHAQQAAPNRFVATAAYGDGGAWYIPVAEAYPQGGYEVNVAFTDPKVESVLNGAITPLAGRIST